MEIKRFSPTGLKTIRLCEARAHARAADPNYEEESGEPAKVGTLAHAAAKFWFAPQHRQQIVTMDDAFAAGLQEVSHDEDMPSNAGVSEAKDMFGAIVGAFCRDEIRVVFAERMYDGFIGHGVPVRMKIDLAIDRGDGVLDIIDFKTGWQVISDDDAWGDDQALLNLLAVGVYDKEITERFNNVSFRFFWARHGYCSEPIQLPPSKMRDYEYALSLEYQRVINKVDPSETLNQYCGSCGRRSECRTYQDAIAEAMGVQPGELPAADTPTVAIMSRLHTLNVASKAVDAAVSTLKGVLKDRVIENQTVTGQKQLLVDGYKAWIQSAAQTDYNKQEVFRLAGDMGVDLRTLVSVSKKRVDDAFGSNELAMRQLHATASKSKGVPYVRLTPPKETTISQGAARAEASNPSSE
jgi:hypothetical protein